MPYQPKTAKSTTARPGRPPKEDAPEGYHRPEHAKPEPPAEPSWEGDLCKACFPDGWPEGNYAGGCGHGYFERKQP